MDQLSAIRTFIRTAERQSFVRAADDLNLSRAMVSMQIAWLERHVATRLLNRTTRRVTLTTDGAWYLDRCRAVLAQLEESDETLRRSREQVKGRLRVDVPVLFGKALLMPALPRFTARHPEVALDLQFNDQVIDLVAERVDLAVRFARVTQPDLIARRIGVTRSVICAAPSYLAEHGIPVRPEQLAEHRLIGQAYSGRGRPRDWVFGGERNEKRMSLRYAMTFNTVDGVLRAGLGGLGIIQTLDVVVGRLIASGRLQALLVPWIAPGPPVAVVYQKSDRNSAKVRVFADFLAEMFQDWSRRSALDAARQPDVDLHEEL
jgi:LysR family transcriptional regulator for bpeEF and oprC